MLQDLAAAPARETPAQARLAPLASNGSLAQALERARAQGLPVMAELKQASPSEGVLLRTGPQEYLDAVRRGGACAVSAVTAAGHFGGSLQALREANATGLPCLMKDFVTGEAQLEAACRHGASAVLLIERLLGPRRREELVRAAHARGLEVLLEVHGDGEAEAALASSADLLGVNSRDLSTLGVDVPAALGTLARLAERRPTLLLSGVHGPAQAEAAASAGAAGILVGTGLLRARDPALAVRALRRPLAKVCGNRDARDVAAALAAGADLVGVIIGTGGVRDVPPARAALLLHQAAIGGAASVLVTRDRTHDELVRLARDLRPAFLQVHGGLDAATVQALHGLGVGVLHAIAPGAAPTPGCDGSVTDTDGAGGSGRRHDGQVPTGPGIRLVAGGLDATSVPDALPASRAHGADASSRLETDGRKDPAKVWAFVAATHAARRMPHGA